MERTNEVKRSELWEKIYHIISQIPRRETNGLDCVDPSSASTQIEKLLEPLATDNTLPATPELIKAFDEMEAKAILLKVVPKNCYWEDMDNLTNTPIHYVLKAMNAYAQQSREQEREKVITECIDEVIQSCKDEVGDEYRYDWDALSKMITERLLK